MKLKSIIKNSMKLFEVKKLPFGVYYSLFGSDKTYTPEQILDWYPDERNLILYGRTSDHLYNLINIIIENSPLEDKPGYSITPLTADKRILLLSHSDISFEPECWWVNHTGDLTTTSKAKEYYNL